MVADLFEVKDSDIPTWVEKGIKDAAECQARPEDIKDPHITLEASPPLRSKIPVKMSSEEEEDMENLIFVHDIHSE